MKRVGIHEAKTHLSRLTKSALSGEEVVILRGREPVVRLVPVERTLGIDAGRFEVPDDFNELPDEALVDFEA